MWNWCTEDSSLTVYALLVKVEEETLKNINYFEKEKISLLFIPRKSAHPSS